MHFTLKDYPGVLFFWRTIEVYMGTFSIATKAVLYSYLVLVAFVLIRGNKKERTFYLVSLLLLILICLNPWMAEYLVKHWGFEPRYFRLFWLIPVSMGYTYFGVRLYGWLSKKGKIVFYVLVVLAFLFSYYQIYKKSFALYTGYEENTGLMPVANIYKVEDDIVEACDMIEEDCGDPERIKMTMYDYWVFIEARSYDGSICPMYPYGEFPFPELDDAVEEEDWEGIFAAAFTEWMGYDEQKNKLDVALLSEACKHTKCEYVILPKNHQNTHEWIMSCKYLGETENYYILRVHDK